MQDPMMQGAMPQMPMEAEQPGEMLTCPSCGTQGVEADFLAAGMQGAGAGAEQVGNMAQMVPEQPQMSPEEQIAMGYNDKLEAPRRGNVQRQAELLKAW